MANITDVVVTRGRALLGEATKPLYAWIGAGDIAVSQVVALPARAQDRLQGLRGSLPASPASVRTAVEGYGALARDGFSELARRGERVVGTVRNRPSTESESPIDAEKVAQPPAAQATKKPPAAPATKKAPRSTATRKAAPRKAASRTKTQ
jgi:hypothetical protein